MGRILAALLHQSNRLVGRDKLIDECPLLAISGHSSLCAFMSAFGGKADIKQCCWPAPRGQSQFLEKKFCSWPLSELAKFLEAPKRVSNQGYWGFSQTITECLVLWCYGREAPIAFRHCSFVFGMCALAGRMGAVSLLRHAF